MKAARTVVLALFSMAILAAAGSAQSGFNDLFQFSIDWQQASNESNFDLNLHLDATIDEQDLLLWIAEWRFSPPSPTPSPTPGIGLQEITIGLPGDVLLTLVRIPAGSFLMGRNAGEQDSDPAEDPQHPVTISQDFYLGKHEVTKLQWEAVMGTTPWSGYQKVLNDPASPAVFVSWNDVQAFMAALNRQGLGTFRLPSEAEWEYACRAGTQTRFYWGDDQDYIRIGDYAWYWGNCSSEQYAHVVGQKMSNAWGLHDMSGNVWEWCQDWYGPYSGEAATDPGGPVSGSYRVLRGGSWGYVDFNCRSAVRDWYDPDAGIFYYGFRLAGNL